MITSYFLLLRTNLSFQETIKTKVAYRT